MLESSNGELKIMMINMLRALMEEVDNILEQMGNIRRERETLRRNKKMLEIKNTKTEIKNAPGGLICRPDRAEARISEPEDMSIEMSQTKMQRERMKKRRMSRNSVFDDREEMDMFLETYSLPGLNHDETEFLSRLSTSKEIESVIKILPRNKTLGPHGFTGEFYQICKEFIPITALNVNGLKDQLKDRDC